MRGFILGVLLLCAGVALAQIPYGNPNNFYHVRACAPGHVWNPSDKSTGTSLTNGNQDATNTVGGQYNTVRATTGLTSGKWYWEILILNQVSNNMYPGVLDTTTVAIGGLTPGGTNPVVGTTKGAAFSAPVAVNGNYYAGMTGVAGGALSYVTNDILNFAVDITLGRGWVGKNGTYASGNPSTNTSPTWTFTATQPIYPLFTGWDANSSGRIVDGFNSAFTYAVPSGFTCYGQAP